MASKWFKGLPFLQGEAKSPRKEAVEKSEEKKEKKSERKNLFPRPLPLPTNKLQQLP